MQPTMCSRCGKNVAVVFITKIEFFFFRSVVVCFQIR